MSVIEVKYLRQSRRYLTAPKDPVPAAPGRGKGNDPQHILGTTAHIDPLVQHLLGKPGFGQLEPVLYIDLIDIGVGVHGKSNLQAVASVV